MTQVRGLGQLRVKIGPELYSGDALTDIRHLVMGLPPNTIFELATYR